jgi:hypothetical protein
MAVEQNISRVEVRLKKKSVRAAATFRFYSENYPRYVTACRNIHALLHGRTVTMVTQT